MDRGVRPAGAEDHRRGRRRLHPAARRRRHREVDDRRGPQGRRRRRPRPRRDHVLRRRPGLRRRRQPRSLQHMRDQCRWFGGMVGNHVADIVAKYGDTRRRAAGADRLHQGPRGLRLQQHGKAGNDHADFVPDEIVDRFCILGTPEDHVAKLEELKAIGVDQFAVYLQHDNKEETMRVYGESIMPGAARPRDGEGLTAVTLAASLTAAPRASLLGAPSGSWSCSAPAWDLYKAFGPDDGCAGRRQAAACCRAPPTWRCRTPGRSSQRLGEPVTSLPDAPVDAARGLRRQPRSPWRSRPRAGVIGVRRRPAAGAADEPVPGRRVGAAAVDRAQPDRAADRARAAGAALGLARSIGSASIWTDEQSVAVIAAYLAFFPVAVGALRGLKSPDRTHLDLMHAYGAGLVAHACCALRLPASVPFLLPALRLAAASAVIGTVVAEVSHRPARRHRPDDHRVRPVRHLRPRQAVGPDLRLRRRRPRRRRRRRPARPAAPPLPTAEIAA